MPRKPKRNIETTLRATRKLTAVQNAGSKVKPNRKAPKSKPRLNFSDPA